MGIFAVAASVLLALIGAYQRSLRWFVGPACRFHPSCSVYASDAISRHGARRGTWMAARRMSRCHPWNPGGYDPVPPLRS